MLREGDANVEMTATNIWQVIPVIGELNGWKRRHYIQVSLSEFDIRRCFPYRATTTDVRVMFVRSQRNFRQHTPGRSYFNKQPCP